MAEMEQYNKIEFNAAIYSKVMSFMDIISCFGFDSSYTRQSEAVVLNLPDMPQKFYPYMPKESPLH